MTPRKSPGKLTRKLPQKPPRTFFGIVLPVLARRVFLLGVVCAVSTAVTSAPAQDAALDDVDSGMPGDIVRPLVEPRGGTTASRAGGVGGIPAGGIDLDPAVLGPPPGQPAAPLRREGDFIIERTGGVTTTGVGLSVIRFDQDPTHPDAVALPPMVLQPCQRLESMLAALHQQGDRVRFTLTGQVHVYHGVNYLLPTEISGYSTVEPEPEPESKTEAAPQPGADAPPADAATDGTAADTSDVPAPEAPETPDINAAPDADPADLMNAMSAALDDKPRPTRSPRAPAGPAGSAPNARRGPALPPTADDGEPHAPLRREGEFILQRAGRVIRSSDAQSVLFAFEADGGEGDNADPPMVLLPCRLLERMERITTRRGDAQVFMLSGRVYTFQGENYLLPTVMKLRIDDGNLGG